MRDETQDVPETAQPTEQTAPTAEDAAPTQQAPSTPGADATESSPVVVPPTPWPNQQEPLEGVKEVSQDPNFLTDESTQQEAADGNQDTTS